MANLRGSSLDKQIKDAYCRLGAIGVKRHGGNDHKTHSIALNDKREMYINDFRAYLGEDYNGKLNQAFTVDIMESFLADRLSDLSQKTAQNYISGFSSMLDGLREANIDIPLTHEDMQGFKEDYRDIHDIGVPSIRGVDNPTDTISKLYERDYHTGLVADIAYNLGLRASEAIELAAHPDKYFQDGYMVGLVGKGGQEYPAKEIPFDIIKNMTEEYEPKSYDTINRNIKDIADCSLHDFRYEFAKSKMDEYLESGFEYKEALTMVSEEMNHHRAEITAYYLKRGGY